MFCSVPCEWSWGLVTASQSPVQCNLFSTDIAVPHHTVCEFGGAKFGAMAMRTSRFLHTNMGSVSIGETTRASSLQL